jgi:hypothetical protein
VVVFVFWPERKVQIYRVRPVKKKKVFVDKEDKDQLLMYDYLDDGEIL